MATTTAETPWGKAALLDEVVLRQRAPGPRAFSTHVQLLETQSGERLVRLAYATAAHGKVRRGPVTMRLSDVARLFEELEAHPELAAVLGRNGTATRLPTGGREPRRRGSPG
jgi:hypothetical protein